MPKKIKEIREIPSKVKEVGEKGEETLEEEISDVEEENFSQFVSAGISAPVLGATEGVQEIPAEEHTQTEIHQPEPTADTPPYVTSRIETPEEEQRRYNPSIERGVIKEGTMQAGPFPEQRDVFRNQELAGMRAGEDRESKYEIKAEMKKETKRRYPWEA